MNDKNIKISATLLAFSIFFLPVVSWAAIGIPCDGPNCTFDDVIKLVNNVIHFLMFSVAVPLAALSFMFMGGKMVLSPNKESSKTEAKEGMTNIAIGFGIILGAYVLIKTVLFMFLNTEDKGLMSLMQSMFQ